LLTDDGGIKLAGSLDIGVLKQTTMSTVCVVCECVCVCVCVVYQ